MNVKLNIKTIGRALGIILFIFILFTNIKIALSSDDTLSSNAVSIFGYKIVIFEPTKAGKPKLCDEICTSQPNLVCTYIVEHGYCFGQFK
ncbi:MAG: hypothetical protein AB1432_08085 [Bacteroidota bacterium]|jgi:hypothetical protein